MDAIAIAQVCHEANRRYCQTLGDHSQVAWEDAPDWQRESAVNGVEYHVANPESTPADSHENWLRKKESEGWVFGRFKDAELKRHPCMLPYDKLPLEQRRKDALFLAIVRALAD